MLVNGAVQGGRHHPLEPVERQKALIWLPVAEIDAPRQGVD